MSEYSFSIEPLNSDIEKAYSILLPEQNAAGVDFLRWKFDRTPHTRGQLGVARLNGWIVALSAYVGQRFQFGTLSGIGWQAIDSIVAPTARGHGLFSRLAAAVASDLPQAVDIVWGFPNANAAPAWFNRLGWHNHGQVPLLVKPLRLGYMTRRLGFSLPWRLTLLSDRGEQPKPRADISIDALWTAFSNEVPCAVHRSSEYLQWRLFDAPHANYRVISDCDRGLVASRLTDKHGGRIAYIMDVFGTRYEDLLYSELGHLVDAGAEVALAWCFPWSPNYALYRKAGFSPLPKRFRSIEIHFGSKPATAKARISAISQNWYLSYLDSDTV